MPAFYSADGSITAEDGKHYNTLMAGLFHPLSHGSTHIASSDPLTAPAINPGFLTNSFDLDLLTALVKFSRKLLTTAPYSQYIVQTIDPPLDIDTDDEIKEWIRSRVEPFYHPVSTAPLLPRTQGGVVDTNLKVYGTKNLRVVSIYHDLVSYYPDADL